MYISNFSWKGHVVWMYEAILYSAVAYTLLCKLNYSYHNQTRSPNGTLFSCKICHGWWEKYELSCNSKISKSLKKQVEKTGLGSFKGAHSLFCFGFFFFFKGSFLEYLPNRKVHRVFEIWTWSRWNLVLPKKDSFFVFSDTILHFFWILHLNYQNLLLT